VHVNVDEPRRQNRVTEIDYRRSSWDFPLNPRRNGRDGAFLNKQERILYLFERRVQTTGAEDDHVWQIRYAIFVYAIFAYASFAIN